MIHLEAINRRLLPMLSGWQDSNLRPPHPKCGAIPGYATPRTFLLLFTLKELPVNGLQR